MEQPVGAWALWPGEDRDSGGRKCLNQDFQKCRMSERIYDPLTYKIIGSTMKAQNRLGKGKPT